MVYTQDDLKMMQETQLQILRKIDEFCRFNHIKYSLYAGTLIGAVRHHGFIPWDDDVDIAMPRDDYDRFCLLASVSFPNGYFLINHSINSSFPFPHSQVMKTGTLAVLPGTEFLSFPHCIFVDIYPFDYVENEKKAAQFSKQLIKWNVIQGRKITPINKMCYWGKKNGGLSAIIAKMIPEVVINAKLKGGNCGNHQKKECVQFYEGKNGFFEQDLFSELIELPFEDLSAICFKKYDLYLKKIYGDYMSLPPLKDRQGHHDYVTLKF